MKQLHLNVLQSLKDCKIEHAYSDLNCVWQECGRFSSLEFNQAWNNLAELGFVHGLIDASPSKGGIQGLGAITPAGEAELGKTAYLEFDSPNEYLRQMSDLNLKLSVDRLINEMAESEPETPMLDPLSERLGPILFSIVERIKRLENRAIKSV